MLRRLTAAAAGLALALTAGAALAADFYEGKTIRVLVNFPAGGAADLEARVFAKHIRKYIAGAPTLAAQNLDGGNGMAGVNLIGRDAARDGTLLGYLTGVGARASLSPETFQVDFRNFEMIALSPGASIYFARADTKPGIRKPEDILNVDRIFVGGVGAASSKDLTQRLTLDMLGVRYGYIPGYAGTTGARLALEKGEIGLYSENRPAYQTIIAPMVASGALLPIFYDPSYDGETLTVAKSVADLPVKPFHEFYKSLKGAYPSGGLWEAYKTILSTNNSFLRCIVLPPGTPKAAVDALRAAFDGLSRDKEFIAEANEVLGFAPDYVTSPQLNDMTRKMLEIAPDMRAWLERYIAAGK
jgi:tripartite-type tricarboxylate transporter receptor subunit TctC